MSENDNEKPDLTPTVVLDQHRGMTAQKETDARRQESGVRADQAALRQGQASLEKQLFAGPAPTWAEAGEKAAYLLRLFAAAGGGQDPRYKQLIEDTLEDIHRLGRNATPPAL